MNTQYPIGCRVAIGRNSRTTTGTVTRVGETTTGQTTVTIEFRVPGGRGLMGRTTGIVGIDSIRRIYN